MPVEIFIIEIILGICIVFGGTFVGLLLSYPLRSILGLIHVIAQAPKYKPYKNLDNNFETISLLVTLAEKARREGILALEMSLDEIEDDFMKSGLTLAIDGVEPELTKDILQTELAFVEDRHKWNQRLLTDSGKITLAMGILALLVNIIILFLNVNEPSTLIPGIAMALLGPLYGIILAYFIFFPFSTKLTCRTSEEILIKEVAIEGILSIQSGDNPRILEQKLLAFISPRQRPPLDE